MLFPRICFLLQTDQYAQSYVLLNIMLPGEDYGVGGIGGRRCPDEIPPTIEGRWSKAVEPAIMAGRSVDCDFIPPRTSSSGDVQTQCAV